ncbi:putative transporter MCH2 [Lasiodiplodia theobromae]|uniref:Putative transporter MCH2 n=1 Tax=Lasiodiplodia theobromae TaxID=45133 RepID=A0A5N5D2G0_9PEZI|nr:putative transporter MCH2 [Lasiodiplodia theobromae]
MMNQQPDSPYADEANASSSEKHDAEPPFRTEEDSYLPQEQSIDSLNAQVDQQLSEGGYGWVCVACAFLIYAHSWGIASTYGVFLAYYKANDVFPNASSIGYAFVGGLTISCCVGVAPLANYLSHAIGASRPVILLGTILECVALLGASYAKQQWHMILTQGICLGLGIGFQFIIVAGIIPQWFVKRRSFANSITVGGAGIGGFIYALAAQRMLASLSLQKTFWILCGVTTAVNTVSALLVRDRNKESASNLSKLEFTLLKRPDVLLLLGWSVFSMLGYVALMFSIPSYARAVGGTASQGALAGAIFNLGQGLGRPTVGLISDKCGRVAVASVATLACSALCIVMGAVARRFSVVCGLSFLAGATGGSFWATVVPIAAELVSLSSMPSLSTFVWLSIMAPTLISEAIALVLAEKVVAERPYFSVQIFICYLP